MRCLFFLLTLAATGFAVEGRVFIVTKGGESVRLGLVRIGIYPRSVVEAFVVENKRRLYPQEQQLMAESARHESRLKNLIEQKDWRRVADESAAAAAKLQQALALRRSLFSDFPTVEALAKTKSDADGSFRLDGSFDGDVLMVAFAKRQVGEDTEAYTWVLPPQEWSPPLFLSNDNLFELNTLGPSPELFTGDKAARAEFHRSQKPLDSR